MPARWRDVFRGAPAHALRSHWLNRALITVSAVGAYLKFRDAGLTLFFWGIVGVGLVGLFVEVWGFIKRKIRVRDRTILRRIVDSPEIKISMIEELIRVYSAALKATTLQATLAADNLTPRVLRFLYVEGDLGALIDIGARQRVVVDTPLLAFAVEPDSDMAAELPLCLMRVSYVQAQSNLTQARVVDELGDRTYWSDVRKTLRRQGRAEPPRNLVVPHVPDVFSGLSGEGLGSIINHLEQVRGSLRALCSVSLSEV